MIHSLYIYITRLLQPNPYILKIKMNYFVCCRQTDSHTLVWRHYCKRKCRNKFNKCSNC